MACHQLPRYRKDLCADIERNRPEEDDSTEGKASALAGVQKLANILEYAPGSWNSPEHREMELRFLVLRGVD